MASRTVSDDIPVRFLPRLIWQESRFRVAAVSHAGAQGIAPFTPATAAERDLEDPFDPHQAVAAAASLLSSLERLRQPGTDGGGLQCRAGAGVGLAAQAQAPAVETRHYVKAITGRPASIWAKSRKKALSIVGKADAETSASSPLSRWRTEAELPPFGLLTINSPIRRRL